MVSNLLERNASIRPNTSTESTTAAAFNGHEQQVSLLFAIGKWDMNTPDDTQTYPIIWASRNGHDKTIQLLLERGADVNAQSLFYGNALQAACSKGNDKIAQMLLERGADVNAQGGEYGNALQAAHQGGYHNIVQILQGQQCADQSTSYPPSSKRLKVS
ncbi:hypothetical protein N7495_002817 [Penicillium taxi]|uniref:uncharacterized protein n=1 Tax=Penicillium taxi TaxID=168475 RepID=UPI002544D760|nr:uncharacterized protein N7495_002817 [Penicillium taxi]KAJ5902289.1 hypothetical protein N7495_002817 [Penicillium taxi]